ncbi:MAG: hypothetical protein JO090_13035 [Rhizobacter sp.]|nr:hypothetical protein [Rhizobacter sp.]
MEPYSPTPCVKVFVAVARLVRESALTPSAEATVFEILERLAHASGTPEAKQVHTEFTDVVSRYDGLRDAFAPWSTALQRCV